MLAALTRSTPVGVGGFSFIKDGFEPIGSQSDQLAFHWQPSNNWQVTAWLLGGGWKLVAEAWVEGSGTGLEARGWKLLAGAWWLEARGQGLGWGALGWVAGWLGGVCSHLEPSEAISSAIQP